MVQSFKGLNHAGFFFDHVAQTTLPFGLRQAARECRDNYPMRHPRLLGTESRKQDEPDMEYPTLLTEAFP